MEDGGREEESGRNRTGGVEGIGQGRSGRNRTGEERKMEGERKRVEGIGRGGGDLDRRF